MHSLTTPETPDAWICMSDILPGMSEPYHLGSTGIV